MRPDVVLQTFPFRHLLIPIMFACMLSLLTCVAVNTVPTIAYAVSCLAKYMTRAALQHYVYARQVLRHLIGVKHRKLTWCAGKVRYPLKRGEL